MARPHVNFRAFLIVAIFACSSVFCVYAYCANKALGIALGCTLFVFLTAASAVLGYKWRRGEIKARYFLAAVMSLTVAVLSFVFGVTSYDGWNDNMASGYFYVSGRVCCVSTSSGDYKIDLEELSLNGERADGKMRVTVTAVDDNIAEAVDLGDRLTFGAYVSAVKLVDSSSVNSWAYRSDIRFFASMKGKAAVEFGSPKRMEKFLNGMRELLTSNMGDRYGNIAFSMITGDKNALDDDIYDCYTASGLGHIMAVSGLHIGFTVAVLAFALSKLNKKAAFGIITVFLAAYCVIADFSPSVVRASIMAVIAMSAVFVGGRRDILSSLCFAFSIILAFKPFYLFEAGFLLSFGSIFGIALFSNSIALFLKSHGANKKVSDGIATSVSVQIGLAPAQVYFFHGIRVFAVIVNTFVIPYISVVFISVVCLLPIAAIPYLSPVLKVSEYLFIPLDYCVTGLSNIPFSEITVYSSAAIFLCYPAMFIMSGFFMADRGKISVICASILACAAFCFIGSPAPTNVIGAALSTSTESVLNAGGKTYVIGYMHDARAVRDLLIKMKCRRVDGIYLFSIDYKSAENIIYLGEKFDIGAVYCGSFNGAAATLINNEINFVLGAQGDIKPVADGEDFIGYGYENVLFAADDAEYAFGTYDVVRSNTVTDADYAGVYLCNTAEEQTDNVFTLEYGAYLYEL